VSQSQCGRSPSQAGYPSPELKGFDFSKVQEESRMDIILSLASIIYS